MAFSAAKGNRDQLGPGGIPRFQSWLMAELVPDYRLFASYGDMREY